MKLTSLGLGASHLTANELALTCCQAALELKDKGDYEGARKAMGPLWTHVGDHPNIVGLHDSVVAEVLLTVGILTRWVGSRNQIKESQDIARDLISESIAFYESAGDLKKVAAARSELAYCYWREGALDEARIMFNEALAKLTIVGNTRANALLGLAVVEWSASRFTESLKLLTENAPLFSKIPSHAIKGAYHSQLAMVLRNLAPPEKPVDYFKRILREYDEADRHFKLARNTIFRADVKNNIGNIFRELSRFKEAHQNLGQARRLRSSVRDKIGVAQIDDTRAQVFIAEKKFKQAETVARNAVRILEKSGHQCLLADALTTQGIALARLKRSDPAQFLFQKAIEVAHQVGALNKAGIAALTMIEELNDLPAETLYIAYDRASEWLAKSQSPDILLRLNIVARRVVDRARAATGAEQVAAEDPIEALFNKPVDLQGEVLKFEGRVIQRALAKANGSLTRAASSLSMSYQALAYILESRQKDLLKERTPIRRRSRREPPSTENAQQS
ncbi:MAG: tetratricopeptide repeat protein [Acidobacteriota bacterium]